jgi:putative NADH-flavin reductase
MRIIILGATGGIGRLLISGALERGHNVTAFVRAPQKISQTNPRLRVLGGDLYDLGQMTAALSNSEAVLSAFGPATLSKTNLRRDFCRVLVRAMHAAEVRRVLYVSSALLFSDIGILAALLRSTLFRNMVEDQVNAETDLMQPDTEWTIVRPPRLLNKPPAGRIREAAGHLPKGIGVIARGDVANFMLDEILNRRYVKQIVGICD